MPTFAEIGDWIERGLEWICRDDVTVLEEASPHYPNACVFEAICTQRDYDYLHGSGYQAINGLYTLTRQMGRRHGLRLRIQYRVGN